MINIPEHIPHLSLLHIINKRMAIILLQAISVFLFVAKAASQQYQDGNYSIPTPLFINLDEPVDTRLSLLHQQFSPTFAEDFRAELVPVRQKLGWLGYNIAKTVLTIYVTIHSDGRFYDEVESYSQATGLDFGEIVFMNFFYEAGCTSVVGRGADQKSIIFGSNLDFPHANFIRKYTYLGYFSRNGELVYKANGIYGMVGVLRGQKLNSGYENFALAINARMVERGNIIYNLFTGKGFEVVYFVRRVLEMNTYKVALHALENESLATSAYYTIGGTWTTGGCIVERSPQKLHNKTCICDIDPKTNQCNASSGNSQWYIVQTNYDRDQPDPTKDPRRTSAELQITALGQSQFTSQALMNILANSPVKPASTARSLTITTTVCENRPYAPTSTLQMIMWNDYPPGS